MLALAEAGRGLIEDDHTGIERERARNLDAPGERRGQRIAGAPSLARHADPAEQVEGLCLELPATSAGVTPEQAREKADPPGRAGARERHQLQHAEAWRQGWRLKAACDPRSRDLVGTQPAKAS